MIKHYPYAIVDKESLCLISTKALSPDKVGFTCATLKTAVKKKQLVALKVPVRSITGTSIRELVYVRIRNKRALRVVLADIITGSLYDPRTGACLTSSRAIINHTKEHCEWTKQERATTK